MLRNIQATLVEFIGHMIFSVHFMYSLVQKSKQKSLEMGPVEEPSRREFLTLICLFTLQRIHLKETQIRVWNFLIICLKKKPFFVVSMVYHGI